MSDDIKAIIRNLHERIQALEGKNNVNLDTTYLAPKQQQLLQYLKKKHTSDCCWSIDGNQDKPFITGKGKKNSTTYSFEIHQMYGSWVVDFHSLYGDYDSKTCSDAEAVYRCLCNYFSQ